MLPKDSDYYSIIYGKKFTSLGTTHLLRGAVEGKEVSAVFVVILDTCESRCIEGFALLGSGITTFAVEFGIKSGTSV